MPGGHISFQPKRLGETCFLSQPFDFAGSMSQGETITAQVVTATVYQGTDPNPAAIISGLATVANVTQVNQLVTFGVLGVIYELLCQIVTSLNQHLEIAGYLAIIPDLV
jgi:hypothetical protein